MSRRRKRQTRLSFDPLPTSSPASAAYNQQIRNRAATVNYEGSPARSGNKRRKLTAHFAASPPPSSTTAAASTETETIVINDGDTDDASPRPLSAKSRDSNQRTRSLPFAYDDPRSSPTAKHDSSLLPTPDSESFFRKAQSLKPRRRVEQRQTRSQMPSSEGEHASGSEVSEARPRASDNFVDLGSGSDSGSDIIVTPARRRATIAEESDDEDEMPRGSTQRKTNQNRTEARRTSSSKGSENDEDGPSKSSQRRKGLTQGRHKRPKGPQYNSEGDSKIGDGNSQNDANVKGPHSISLEEQQELEDDLEGLKSSSSDDGDARISRQPTAQQKRQAALERLKKSRAKTKAAAPEVISLDDDDDDAAEDNDGDQSTDGSGDIIPEEDALPTSSARDIFGADENDDDFLDDEDEVLGVPDGVPLAFTRYASMKPKELFTFAIEWMVQKKLNPGFNGTDEIYSLAFQKLDDEIKGLAGSKFESAAWRSDFLFALRARPQLAMARMDRHDPDLMWKEKCDACNRSGHIPTYEIQFQGLPYHPDTLEQVENEEDDSDDEIEDEEEEAEKTHRDVKGNAILPQSHSFYVGKFCMANAETAHALQHWKFHLYEWVILHLEEEGHLSDEQIVRRDRWGEPKRRKYANKVVDQMNDRGKVKELYRDFKDEVRRAREAKQSHWGASSD